MQEVVEGVGVVLRDNTYKGVKERGLGGGRRGLLSQSMGSSGAGMALQCCPQLKYSGQAFVLPPAPLPLFPRLTGHWMHAVAGEKVYYG